MGKGGREVRPSISLVLAIVCVGCQGIEFADDTSNMALPDDYKNRTLWPGTDIFKYNLSELAGSYVRRDAGTFTRLNRVVNPGYKPEFRVRDLKAIYESNIDRQASMQGSYLAFAASLKANERAHVKIQDIGMVFIKDDDLPREDIAGQAIRAYKANERGRYYIQGVLLASVTTRHFVEIDASAKGVVGATIGLDSKVYNKRGQSATDFRISVELVDLWALGRALNKGGSPEANVALFVEGGEYALYIPKAQPFEIHEIAGWPQEN
jgi:hypothetical protein